MEGIQVYSCTYRLLCFLLLFLLLCHSSSVKPVDKREGGGAHNWGRQEDSQK